MGLRRGESAKGVYFKNGKLHNIYDVVLKYDLENWHETDFWMVPWSDWKHSYWISSYMPNFTKFGFSCLILRKCDVLKDTVWMLAY